MRRRLSTMADVGALNCRSALDRRGSWVGSGVHGAVTLRAQHPRQGGQGVDELPSLEGVDADVEAVLLFDPTGELLGLLAELRLYLEGLSVNAGLGSTGQSWCRFHHTRSANSCQASSISFS